MKALRLNDPVEFRQRAGPLLMGSEARHNLILGITGTLIDRPEVYPEFYLWVVEEEGQPVAAASMTPPYNLIVADALGGEAVEVLAAEVAGAELPVPGVVGNEPTVSRFIGAWSALTGTGADLRMAQGVFALRRVRPVPPVPGSWRRAREEDRNLLVAWTAAFTREAL
ncbi:MAG TPA: hypothetical protein VIL12_03080, partial [Acidimicrobiia bacterium]